MKPGVKAKPFSYYLSDPTPTGCIEWIGTTVRSNGRKSHRYGRVTRDGKKHLAHRYAWELKNGPIPDGLCVCHRCDNTLCCNVDHLFVGTQKENIGDAARKNRMCRNGAPKRFGKDNHNCKLSNEDVAEIRKMRESGETIIRIAQTFNINNSTVSRIANGISRVANQ